MTICVKNGIWRFAEKGPGLARIESEAARDLPYGRTLKREYRFTELHTAYSEVNKGVKHSY